MPSSVWLDVSKNVEAQPFTQTSQNRRLLKLLVYLLKPSITMPIIIQVAVVIFIILDGLIDADSGPRQNGCAFIYNNRFYILGGDGLNGTTYDSFTYTEFPINHTQADSIVWHRLTSNETFFTPPTSLNISSLSEYLKPCVVTPNGTLIVGGNDLIGYDIPNDNWLGPLHLIGNVTTLLFPPCGDWGGCYDRLVQVDDSLWIFQPIINPVSPPGKDIYILNLTTFTWTTKQQKNTSAAPIPGPLGFTSLYYLSPKVSRNGMNGMIYLIGGRTPADIYRNSMYNNSIWTFDLQSYMWALSPTVLPVPVDHLSLFYYPRTSIMYLFSDSRSNIVQVLNLSVNLIQAAQTYQPPRRKGSIILQYENKLVMYQGNDFKLLNESSIFNRAEGLKGLFADTTSISYQPPKPSAAIFSILALIIVIICGFVVVSCPFLIYWIYRKSTRRDSARHDPDNIPSTTPNNPNDEDSPDDPNDEDGSRPRNYTSVPMMENISNSSIRILNDKEEQRPESISSQSSENTKFATQFDLPNNKKKLDEFLLELNEPTVKTLSSALAWIPYSEFRNLEEIGDGGFATVHKALVKCSRKDDKVVVLKIMNKVGNLKDLIRNELVVNLRLQFHCGSRRLAAPRLLGLSEHKGAQILVMEYAAGGNLERFLVKFPPVSWFRVWQIARGIALRLQVIHQQNFIHNDLHPGNIVFNADSASADPMIIDVGISKAVDELELRNGTRGAYGRIEYLPPEFFGEGLKTQKSDIYCLGTLLWQLTARFTPRETAKYPPQAAASAGLREVPIPGTPKVYVDIYKKCWNLDPDERPTIEQVLEELERIEMNVAAETWLDKNPEARAYLEEIKMERIHKGSSESSSEATTFSSSSRYYSEEKLRNLSERMKE